jgi:predicted anti-sigma-YlaC factor YlaD
MNHYPFEEWLFEEQLTTDQEKQLKDHLAVCNECRELRAALHETDYLLSNLSLAEPEPGFTNRWVIFATKKQETRQKNWMWLLFGSLILSAIVSILILQLPVFLSGLSFIQLGAGLFLNVMKTLEKAYGFIQSYGYILSYLPLRIPAYVWAGVGMNILFWIALWTFSFWKVVQPKGNVK